MSGWSAFVLGVFLVLAALVHGGVYSAGHDFVVNRFTGRYEFVPSDDEETGLRTPIRRPAGRALCLDAPGGRG